MLNESHSFPKILNWFSGVGAAIVPGLQFLYGTSQIVVSVMAAILFFILMDWLSGISAAKQDGTYASTYGLGGLRRTLFILLFPAGGHLLDAALGLPDVVFGLFAFGILYHTIQSMTANAIRAGWGGFFPEWLVTKLMEWVKSELENKLARATSRKESKNDNRN
ncbi:phage holin family protein [Paenibacillus dendritiformis]|uniref:phage holin family protein n=1 Tax=Paenibacillus dendritiformis TaxID=130049 RepID=UPI001F0E68D9|nr:phage holin family protein [Paenibacillus dendritiformis]